MADEDSNTETHKTCQRKPKRSQNGKILNDRSKKIGNDSKEMKVEILPIRSKDNLDISDQLCRYNTH